MSILIKGMDMPNKCTRCIAFRLAEKPIPWDGDVIYEPSVYPYCVLLEREVTCDNRETDCPLIEIDEPKVGEWINDINYSGWTCTNCDYHDGNAVYNYCPNCGAKMERRADEHTD